jgi:transcriptional regulator with XRE-family HTH domain
MGKQKRNNELIIAIGKKLQAMRKENNVSQIDVYIETNINVKRIEAGTQNISVSTLSTLCDYYSVELDDFFRHIKSEFTLK